MLYFKYIFLFQTIYNPHLCHRKSYFLSYKVFFLLKLEKLYFLADSNPPKDLPNAFYFNIDNV